MRASEKRFCDSRGAGGVQGRQICLVFDEFLDRVIQRRRVESILRFTGVGGELVDNDAARGVPQKGTILVACRHGDDDVVYWYLIQ